MREAAEARSPARDLARQEEDPARLVRLVRRVKILRVTVYLDGRKLGTDRKAAFKWAVPTKKLTGDHRMIADALLRPLRQKGRRHVVGKTFKHRKVSVPLRICA
jgi:hypothetical protein